MSYVLKLWDAQSGVGRPNDVQEVVELLGRLGSSAPGQNPRFNLLVQRLTQRFPCIASPQAQRLPESEWAWAEGPLAGNTEQAVLSLALRAQRLQDVRPFVIEQANLLGIGVFDTQAGEAYLPGQVLGRGHPARAAPAEGADCPEGREVEGLLLERLGQLLEPLGYKMRRSDASLKQSFRGGWHVVRLFVQDKAPLHVDFSLMVDTRLAAVSDLQAAIVQPHMTPKETRDWVTTMLNQEHWHEPRPGLMDPAQRNYRVSTRAQLAQALNDVCEQCLGILAPVLEDLKTVPGMDRRINQEPVERSRLFQGFTKVPVHLITAYLARNPQLDVLCDRLPRGVKNADQLEATKRCVEYIRTHPLP